MKILAVGCHPDDLEILCGGTIRRYVKEGHEVYMAHTANGDQGHAVIMPDELRAIRTVEAENAGRVLGVKEVFNIDIGDCMFRRDEWTALERIVHVIRKVNPQVILTHYPGDYMEDHVRVSNLVYEASFSATLPHLFMNELPVADSVAALYYFDTLAGLGGFIPEQYVDITEELDTKLEALRCHSSQIDWMLHHDHIDFCEWVQSCSRYRGLQCGVQYAEAFIMVKAWPRCHTKRLLP